MWRFKAWKMDDWTLCEMLFMIPPDDEITVQEKMTDCQKNEKGKKAMFLIAWYLAPMREHHSMIPLSWQRAKHKYPTTNTLDSSST